MGQTYSSNFEVTIGTGTPAQFLSIVAPSDASLEILSIEFAQVGSGTLIVNMLPHIIARTSSGSSSGTATDIIKHDPSSPTAGTVISVQPSSEATFVDGWIESVWNTLTPFIYRPIPEERFRLEPGGEIATRIDVAPSASMTIRGCVTFVET